jgi:SAM-dependent methyltransferase
MGTGLLSGTSRPTFPGPAASRSTRAFFGVRARNWDTKFGDDLPAYARAVAEAQIPPGAVVADVGCGTGRGTPALRSAVGFRGRVLALDVTREMLDTLRDAGRGDGVHLVMADAQRLPLGTGALDGVFAAGLVPHLRYPEQGLRELARVTRAEGCLIPFPPLRAPGTGLSTRHRDLGRRRHEPPRACRPARRNRMAAGRLRRRRASILRAGPSSRSLSLIQDRPPMTRFVTRTAADWCGLRGPLRPAVGA